MFKVCAMYADPRFRTDTIVPVWPSLETFDEALRAAVQFATRNGIAKIKRSGFERYRIECDGAIYWVVPADDTSYDVAFE